MRKTLYAVTLLTESGHYVSGTVAAYDADDATRLARSMMRANHGESRCAVVNVAQA